MNYLLTIDASLIDWSRAQFALTAIYHWLFVPLTLGLAVIMGIIETIYYRTGKHFWQEASKFWQRLFGVNFAMGVATGIILEFEFGTNWSNYSWFVGDIFGAPACHRRHSSFLYGKHVCCCYVLWMAESFARFSSCLYLAYGYRRHHISMVDTGSQFLDAVPYRLRVQSRYRAQRNDKLYRCGIVANGCRQVLPYRNIIVDSGCRVCVCR